MRCDLRVLYGNACTYGLNHTSSRRWTGGEPPELWPASEGLTLNRSSPTTLPNPHFLPLWTTSSICRNRLSKVAPWFHFLPTLEYGYRLAASRFQSGELLPGKGMGQMTYSSSRRREADFFAHINGQSVHRHRESGGASESRSHQSTGQRLSATPIRNGHIAHGRAST